VQNSNFLKRFLKKIRSFRRRGLPDKILDDVYKAANSLYKDALEKHVQFVESMTVLETPQMLFTAFYQDGLLESLARAIHYWDDGKYLNASELKDVLDSYANIYEEMESEGQYEDLAYIEGYVNGIVFILSAGETGKIVEPPFYFAFGSDQDIFERNDYKKIFPMLQEMNPESYKRAEELIMRMNDPQNAVYQHRPWL